MRRDSVGNRRLKTVLVVSLLLLSVLLAVRVADPFESDPSSSAIDLSESPAEIAHAAVLSTEHRDFTVDFSRRQVTTPTNRSHSDDRRIEYDNTDRQARATIPVSDGNVTSFTNPHFRWTRTHDATRKTGSRGRPRDRFRDEETLLSCDCVRLDAENETTLVFVIEDTNASDHLRYGSGPHLSDEESTLTLYIDKDDATLRKAVVEYRRPQLSNGERTGATVVGREVDVYRDWGETDVRRPSWAGYSFEEFLGDLLNVERRHWIGTDNWGR